MFWIFPVWSTRLSRLEKALILFILIAAFVTALYSPVLTAYKSRNAEATSGRGNTESQPQKVSSPSIGETSTLSDSVDVVVKRAKPTIEFNFASTGEKKQKVHFQDASPTVIQLEPKPTVVKEEDLPADVSVSNGAVTVLKFGREGDGGYAMFDTSHIAKESRIRGEVLAYTEPQKSKPATFRSSSVSNSSPPATTVVQAPGSAFSQNQQGGITAGTINQYGVTPPDPEVSWRPFEQSQPANAQHPRTFGKITVNRPYENALFAVICDRPCSAKGFSVEGYNHNCPGSIPGRPDVAAFVVVLPNPFPPNIEAAFSIDSEDDKPVKIVGVKRLALTNPPTCK
jgi:hypothetical protein